MFQLVARLCRISNLLALAVLPCCCAAGAAPPPVRRALVIGIDHYLAADADPLVIARRRLKDLGGAANDARAMAALLESRGYRVESLLDGAASRAGILAGLERLAAAARPGADLVFFFAGHGSQVASRDPGEGDRLDETLVPADAVRGAADLRDDELRARLWRLLEKGARLTAVIDSCHSGSVLRGLPPQVRLRFAEPAPAPVAAPLEATPGLENGDALLVTATQDFQTAAETADGRHGAFTQALLQVLATAEPDEGTAESLRRAASLLLADGFLQRPDFDGAPARLGQPLFGGRAASRSGRPSAVVIASAGDRVRLEGGSARGLREGDELARGALALRLDAVDPVTSLATRVGDEGAIAAGDVFLRERGGARDVPDLTVLFPRSRLSAAGLVQLAEQVAAALAASGRAGVADPWHDPPTHVLRFEEERGWLLADRGGEVPVHRLSARALTGLFAGLPPAARVFLQLPLPAGSHGIRLGRGTEHDAVQKVERHSLSPLYQLVGRYDGGRLVYGWSRAQLDDGETWRLLPVRTAELPFSSAKAFGENLTELALKLASLRFWLTVESPAAASYPYRLVLRDPATGERVDRQGKIAPPELRAGDRFGLALYAERPTGSQRYVYVVLISSDGRRKLLYPRPGFGGENHLPASGRALEAASEVPFGPQPLLRVGEPCGLDTYVLLTTAEPIPEPMVLDDTGVREPRRDDHPLVRLFGSHHRGRRDALRPTAWSIERLVVKVGC